MEPAKNTLARKILDILRSQMTAVGVDHLNRILRVDSKRVHAAVADLRSRGYEILGWEEKDEVYAYHLKSEALADDPFTYLSWLLRGKGCLHIPTGSYVLKLSRSPSIEGREIIRVSVFRRRDLHNELEFHNIDDKGEVKQGWDEQEFGAVPFIPTILTEIQKGLDYTQPERMVVDHLRAHIVQHFIMRALRERKNKGLYSRKNGSKRKNGAKNGRVHAR